jgi:hypothetical protein
MERDDARSRLVEYAGLMVEEFDIQYEKLFPNDEISVAMGDGLPQQTRLERYRIWKETCGKEKRLWQLVSQRLLSINVEDDDSWVRIVKAWRQGVTQRESIPSYRSPEVRSGKAIARKVGIGKKPKLRG